MGKSWFWSAAVGLAGVASLSSPGSADNLKFSFNENGPFWFGGLTQNIGLNNNNDKSLPFRNPSKGFVAITFTAECQLIGKPQSVVNIDILVDGAIIPITGGDDSFCAGRGVGVQGGWARHAITVAKELGAGAHALRVRARAVGEHSGAQLDNITVMITR